MRVLVADDEPSVRLVVKAAVEKLGHECLVAEDGDRAWALLQGSPIDVLVTDWMMPGVDGPELCRRIRARQTDRYTYIILSTARAQHDDILAGIHAGADDYLVKPLDPFALQTRLIAAERVTALHLQLAENFHAQLAHQVLHDSLTGLPNRLMLTERLDQALARVRRHDGMVAVLFVDLDRFKTVNDTHGHAVGDRLLVEAGARIRTAVRETDTVARLGGDEFVVFCEDIEGVHHATDLAQRIITTLQDPFYFGADNPRVSASVGIALCADGTKTTDAILDDADLAMYRAKDNGRARYELFDAAMQTWVTTQVTLETALREAVPRDELRLYCQPVVEAESGIIRGFEALLRWERPGYGLVEPDSFLTAAEDSGLIVGVGAWVLEQACRHAATWARRWPDRRLRIAVNVSGRQLRADIVDLVTATLAGTGLDPVLLTLELTEIALIDDAVNAQALLGELRALGVNLALDRFGTGYSSLTYLRAFPINVVKIDKSFVGAIGTERQDSAIVGAVLALAENLDLKVVAAGIETRAQLALLRELGCPLVQGYLFSQPIPIEEAGDLIQLRTLGVATDRSAGLRPAP